MTRKPVDFQMNGGLQLGFEFSEEEHQEQPATVKEKHTTPAAVGPTTVAHIKGRQPMEPMSKAAVAWIAQHVIADYHLANETAWCDPDQNWEPRCACQMTCTLCRAGRHSQCRELRQTPWAGQHGPFAPRPETHLRLPAPHSPQRTGPLYVAVWLADRSCRYLCDCPQCAVPRRRALLASHRGA
ncbi:hypothetical protein ACWDSL_06650 [Streptomyces sp. NPDC000941]